MCVTDAPFITNHEPDPCSPPHTLPSLEVQDIKQTRIFSIENTCTQDPLANATNKFDSEKREQSRTLTVKIETDQRKRKKHNTWQRNQPHQLLERIVVCYISLWQYSCGVVEPRGLFPSSDLVIWEEKYMNC